MSQSSYSDDIVLTDVKLKYRQTIMKLGSSNSVHYFQVMDEFPDNQELSDFRVKTKLCPFWSYRPKDAKNNEKHYIRVSALPPEFFETWLHRQIYDCDVKVSTRTKLAYLTRIVKDPFIEK